MAVTAFIFFPVSVFFFQPCFSALWFFCQVLYGYDEGWPDDGRPMTNIPILEFIGCNREETHMMTIKLAAIGFSRGGELLSLVCYTQVAKVGSAP